MLAKTIETKAKQIDDNLRLFDGITSALYAPNSNGIIGDTVRAASPQLAYRIGQEFKRKDQEGSAQHLLAHAILGAAVSYATGNNITTGALSGASSEVAAPALSDFLFNTKDPKELTQEQKDTITSIITLGTASIAYGAMGDVSVAVNASEVGKGVVENNAVNKSQSGNIIAFIEFFNNTNTKMGQLVGSDAEKAMLRLNDTNFKLMPSVTPPFNGINDRYIYTTKGGWIDMVHFLFYASEAYSHKKEMMENPSTSYLGLTQQEIVSKSINHAVKRGYLQEKLDSIKAPHSAYSYEDLPSDYYGAVFGANHFDPKSKISFGQQIYNYFKQELDVKSPYHAPNYNDLPDIDNKKHSGIFNRTINPMFIP